MSFNCQVSRTLDDEHRSSLDLLGRVEQAFARSSRSAPDAKLLQAFVAYIENDVGHHFDFEERELFPRLEDAGEGDIAGLLNDEHEAMRQVAEELLPLARQAVAGTLDDAGFETMRRTLFEMVERQVAHIQKETMALLPALDNLLDEETDRELAFAHAGG
jgi:hemerythrin-like domain-containing protein